MTDNRKTLTEETPESPKDFKQRQLTEVGGAIRHDPQPKVLTEDLPQEDLDEDEDSGPQMLLG